MTQCAGVITLTISFWFSNALPGKKKTRKGALAMKKRFESPAPLKKSKANARLQTHCATVTSKQHVANTTACRIIDCCSRFMTCEADYDPISVTAGQ